MKQFSKILKFELKGYLSNKAFVGITLFLVVAIAVVMFIPRFIKPDDGQGINNANRPAMLIVNHAFDSDELVEQNFSALFPGYSVTVSKDGIDDIKKIVELGSAECAIDLKTTTSYDYYVKDLSMYDTNTEIADAALQGIYRMNAMIAHGISPEEAGNILSAGIEHETIALGKDQFNNFFYTYIMIFALYMVIMLYGQMVATNVAREKSSRAMELLITSAEPSSMMFGKVIASCTAGFLQIVAVFGSAFLFFNLNRSYWESNMIMTSIFDMPLNLLIYMLVFFILGFLIYAFLYGAVGSTVSKLEDVNTAVMPITFLFIFAFFVVMFSMSGGSVDSLIMIVCSYIPFTSPMAMFTRIAMSTVPLYEILISIAILIVSVLGTGVLSAKIYRLGVLMYGTPPKIPALIKSVFGKN